MNWQDVMAKSQQQTATPAKWEDVMGQPTNDNSAPPADTPGISPYAASMGIASGAVGGKKNFARATGIVTGGLPYLVGQGLDAAGMAPETASKLEGAYERSRQAGENEFNDQRAKNPATMVTSEIAGNILSPVNKAKYAALLANSALNASGNTDFSQEGSGRQFALNTAANDIGGHIVSGAASLIPGTAKAKAAQIMSKYLGPQGEQALGESYNTAVQNGAGDLPAHLTDNTGDTARLVAALGKRPDMNQSVSDIADKAGEGVEALNQSQVQPLYNQVNAEKLNTFDLNDMLTKNPAIAKAIENVKFNLGEKAPTDTMALLTAARQDLGSDNPTAYKTLTSFLERNGPDSAQFTPAISAADQAHANLLGTYNKSISSPGANLKIIKSSLAPGANKDATQTVKELAEPSGVTEGVKTALEIVQNFTAGRMPTFFKNAADKKALAAALEMSNQTAPEVLAALAKKYPQQGIQKIAPYLGVSTTQALFNALAGRQ